ncbi:unnamed protein product (macronuclear) [Paramecium tetraurelia]|uniref:Uncharacterized protein n=1 Tax=Paramecium tetraurelia TaxID=5888 RepID=A0DU24_PARTE|nr:uncharacterized protein GSPATT00039767001 [Paramecium tetraurelia]CAK86541.1 unnamed protein product [Paramecium tetraurelia]|eukprot:XP_001453938.1 hypothetical protein (macronuclear) [Paramecium tetraurelia strain d4-2]
MNDESPNRSKSIEINLTKMLDRMKNNSFHMQKVCVGDLINKSQTHVIAKPIRQQMTPTPEEKENKELTFKPQINKKYPNYLNQTSFLERNEQWQKNKLQKQQETSKTYLEEKEKIINKECSFKPKITPHQSARLPRQQKQQPQPSTNSINLVI